MNVNRIGRRSFPLLTAALLAVLPLACKKAEPSPEEDHPAPVKAMKHQSVEFGEWTEILGVTQPLPDRVARITAAVEGRVTSVLRDGKKKPLAEGDAVEKNQVVATLDARVPEAHHEKLKANQAELNEQKKQAQLAVDLAKIEVKRLADLSAGPASPGIGVPLVSKIDRDKAEIARKEAESKQAGLASKEAALQAEIKAHETQLDYYLLRAPIAGRLSLLQVAPGQTLAVGTTVAEVIDLEEIDVLCFVPPHVAAKIKVKQDALLEPAAQEGPQNPKGQVVFVAVQAHADTGNFAIKVRFKNTDLKLRANTIARVHVLTEPIKPRNAIRESALIEDQDPPLVLVAEQVKSEKNAEGKLETLAKARKLRPILGVRDRREHRVEIVGLEDPETHKTVPLADVRFVIEGGNGVRNGDSLKLEEDDKK